MNKLEWVLANLKRPVEVLEYSSSPQFHRVRVKPLHRALTNGGRGAMTQAKHLRNLEEDIALGLGIDQIEVARVNGTLWLHIPRENRGLVRLDDLGIVVKEVPWVLGRTVENKNLSLDLADPASPHVLIAGTTGSGKTVGVKAGLAYLTRYTNTHVVVIDVKNELGVFERFERVKYTTDPEVAIRWLWTARELSEDRFEKRVDPSVAGHWVIVVDEFADLMFQYPEVEGIVVRLGQKVRSAGMHLVIATQRPTVDVVTGLIKANMPVRVAYQVVSKIDSRVIIDQSGAEKLLGKGDGLLMMNGKTTRFQGAFVSDMEIGR